jgi:hypothetical protein
MQYLKPSSRPEEVLELLASPEQPKRSRMYRPGFDHYLSRMPHIDARHPNPAEEVALTLKVMEAIAADVTGKLNDLDLPLIPDRQFGRVILGIEDPTDVNGELVPGTEVVLALWGNGFQSPVHGHAAGYIHEGLLKGSFDVHLYKQVGQPEDRTVVHERTIVQDTPGTFYSSFVQEAGQAYRSALIHNFTARERSFSLHYLPEHVRDGKKNGFTVLKPEEASA